MRVREKRNGTEVDWAVEAFMKAAALEGQPQSIVSDLALRLLDMEVLPVAFPPCRRTHACMPACWR